jgi:hypothetical protein
LSFRVGEGFYIERVCWTNPGQSTRRFQLAGQLVNDYYYSLTSQVTRVLASQRRPVLPTLVRARPEADRHCATRRFGGASVVGPEVEAVNLSAPMRGRRLRAVSYLLVTRYNDGVIRFITRAEYLSRAWVVVVMQQQE